MTPSAAPDNRSAVVNSAINGRTSHEPAAFEPRKFDFSRVTGLSTRTLETHKTLYEGYVKEANALLPFVYPKHCADDSVGAQLQRDGLVRRFAFERNGMVLHELFFEALRGRSEPPRSKGAFMNAIERCYGSYDAWHNDLSSLAKTRGVGWVMTVQYANDNRLGNVWIDEHSHGVLSDWTPVLAVDLWEHAYILDFKPSERAAYLTTLFENIDWEVVEARCV